MKLECTLQELKELLQNNTPVAGTTDVKNIKILLDGHELASKITANIFKSSANHDIIEEIKQLSEPIIEFIKKYYNLHTTVIISTDCIKVVADELSIPISYT